MSSSATFWLIDWGQGYLLNMELTTSVWPLDSWDLLVSGPLPTNAGVTGMCSLCPFFKNGYLKIHLIYFVYLHVCKHVCAIVCVCKSEDNPWESVSSVP